FFQAEDGIRDFHVTGVQTCALPISAMTPSRRGRMASMLPGVRPSICLASSPTARTCFLPRLVVIATTEGSLRTMPRPLTYTRVRSEERRVGKEDRALGGTEQCKVEG